MPNGLLAFFLFFLSPYTFLYTFFVKINIKDLFGPLTNLGIR